MRRRVIAQLQNHALALRLLLTADLRPGQNIGIGLMLLVSLRVSGMRAVLPLRRTVNFGKYLILI